MPEYITETTTSAKKRGTSSYKSAAENAGNTGNTNLDVDEEMNGITLT